MKQRKLQIIFLNSWRERYSYAIPTLFTSLYVALYFCTGFALTNSKHLNDSLYGIITAVSILTGFLSALLGIVLQSRDTSKGIQFFFSYVEKRKFVTLLKYSVLSGFFSIFMSCLLYFSDVLNVVVATVISFGWVWGLVYYLTSTYRFVNLFIMLLITEKEEEGKKEQPGRTREEREKAKEEIKKSQID